MQIKPELIILKKKEDIFKKRFFLISGNEETLIKKIEHIILSKLKSQGYNNIKKNELIPVDSRIDQAAMGNLFGESQVEIFHNPKDIDYNYLKLVDFSNLAIIVSHTNLKKSSKIVSNIERDPDFISINCYKIGLDSKKQYFDNFVNSHKLKIEKDCYWYFLENTSDFYQLFENEMEKLRGFEDEKISLNQVEKMLTKYNNTEIERLFFLITQSPKEIVLKTSQLIQNVGDGMLMLQSIKYFINLISASNSTSEAEKSFPRYLFKEKQKYLLIFNKLDNKKMVKVFKLIKKAELTLRKNSSLYLPISQRFLINLARQIK